MNFLFSEELIIMDKSSLYFYLDILMVGLLTDISIIWFFIPLLNSYPLNIIPYLLLFGFLPGYGLLTIIKLETQQLNIYKRIISSIVLSIGLTLLFIILSNYKMLSIPLTIILPILSLTFIIITFIRRWNKQREDRVLKKIKDDTADVTPVLNTKNDKLSLKLLDEPDINIPEAENKINDEEEINSKENRSKPRYKDNRGKFHYITDLLLISSLAILTLIFVLLPGLNDTIVRTILGLIFILFIPGYSLIAALFPKKDELDTIERLALSFGLSIAITPLTGLMLNYTPYGIRLDPILLTLTGLTLALVLAAFIRRYSLPANTRFYVNFTGFFRTINTSFSHESRTGKILSVILALTILCALAGTIYAIVTPKQGESFTEFYILGPNGSASGYPTNLTEGQSGNIIIGVVNHENKQVNYRILVTSDNTVQFNQDVSLNNGQKIELPFNFTAGNPGTPRMDFLLYKLPDTTNNYRNLHLWLNITTSGNVTS